MTQFKAPPLPPRAPSFPSQEQTQPQNTPFQSQQPTPVDDVLDDGFEIPEDNFITKFNLSPSILKTNTMLSVLGAAVFIGLLFGFLLFSGGSSGPTMQNWGFVPNRDNNPPLRRCGQVGNTDPCILYIMNATRYDKLAEDFFAEAEKLTGRQKYVIAIENQGYAKQRIQGGLFAQIKIPRLK